MKREIKYLILSLVTGILLLVALYSFGYFAAQLDWSHPGTIFGLVGYLIIALLTLPLFGFQEPPLWLLIGTALFDVWCLSLPIYLLNWFWRHRRTPKH
jgi:hypothetical protein